MSAQRSAWRGEKERGGRGGEGEKVGCCLGLGARGKGREAREREERQRDGRHEAGKRRQGRDESR